MTTVTLSPTHSYADSEENGNSSGEVTIEQRNKPLVNKADTPEKARLRLWLNKSLRIEMSDGRVLIGVFLCTDRDSNIILGSCSEYLTSTSDDPRILGLVMVPGRHIVSIYLDCFD